MSRLVVVGSANVDHVVVVARLPDEGETVPASAYVTAPGGKGLNQAVAAARQGDRSPALTGPPAGPGAGASAPGGREAGRPEPQVAVTMVACVGDDAEGDGLLRLMAAEGIDASGVRQLQGERTGVALVTVARGGTNTVVIAPLANSALSPGDVDRAGPAIEEAVVVLTQLEVPIPVVERTLVRARAAGAITVLNPAPAPGPLPAGLLALVDILVPNETEASLLAGVPAEEAGPALVALGCGTVVTTLGRRGALVATAAGVTAVAPFPVDAVDSTAAGDAFCGALAAGLAAGLPLSGALRRASAAGALATTVTGAVPSLPGAAAVDALLASGGAVGPQRRRGPPRRS